MIKSLVALFFTWAVWERVSKTFGKGTPRDPRVTLKEKLHSLLMILAYVSIAVAGFLGFLTSSKTSSYLISASGVFIYLLAQYWRNIAIKALGKQRSVHTTAVPVKKVISLGPFAYTRHPYYHATLLELFAYSLVFQSVNTAAATLLIFVPLIFTRIWVEEKKLVQKFPRDYHRYQGEVPVFFDLLKFFKETKNYQDLSQIFSIIKRFGVQQLLRIRFMSQAVIHYSRGYAVSRIAGSMIDVGFIERMLKDGKVDLVAFSSEKNYDLSTLKIISDYFSILGIFRKEHFNYSLTEYGKKLFLDSRGVFTLLYAYMPVFESLPAIIRKQKKYGLEINRVGEFVGRGSAELAELLPFPYAKDILKRHRLNRILDLGCGSGDFLIEFCENGDFTGTGIDLSPEVIEFAKKQAKSKGLDPKVRFIAGDLRNLEEARKKAGEVDVLTSMFVMHEFLDEGPDALIEILKGIRKNFPDSYLLITEVYRWDVGMLTQRPVPVAEHHLFHRLSRQGLATVKEWRAFFRKSGFRCVEERRFDRAAQVYFLLEPVDPS